MQGKIILDETDIEIAIQEYIMNKYKLVTSGVYVHYSSGQGQTTANAYYDIEQLEGRKL
jgi:hypothetical protein